MDHEAHFDGRRVQEAGVVVASATVGTVLIMVLGGEGTSALPAPPPVPNIYGTKHPSAASESGVGSMP